MNKGDSISRTALLAAYDAAHKGPPGGARKLIEEAPAVDAAQEKQWISVKDRLPEHGKRYLIYATSGNGEKHHISTTSFGGHFALSGRCAYWHVTHWMPLPEPPKERYPEGFSDERSRKRDE